MSTHQIALENTSISTKVVNYTITLLSKNYLLRKVTLYNQQAPMHHIKMVRSNNPIALLPIKFVVSFQVLIFQQNFGHMHSIIPYAYSMPCPLVPNQNHL
uniref:Uncharacterized protein n=1 Tax=Pseudo-nitzschia australis TaxID=44445 RepID=A0A7S4ALF0_9STRA